MAEEGNVGGEERPGGAAPEPRGPAGGRVRSGAVSAEAGAETAGRVGEERENLRGARPVGVDGG